MEETQQQPLRPSFPPAGAAKWLFNASGGSAGGSSFGQDSGYASYQSTTPNNTFNLSSRHGASATLATIDEASEGDCSMNDSGSSAPGGVCSNILTPKTAASIDQISNFHLTTPNSAVRPKRPIRRRFDFDSAGATDGSFVAPTTPERLPLSRSVSFDSSDTPLRTGNRSGQPSQLTPHKAKGGHSVKRKLSSLRGKLYSDDGDGDAMASAEDAGDENRANDLNDSLDCKRLDISPIPKVKRHKPNENITNLIRSSTPKTASSQPRFLGAAGSTENIGSHTLAPGDQNAPAPMRKTFRKFQSFSPSKMQSNRQKSSLRPRQEDRGPWPQANRLVGRTGGFGLRRQDPLAELELTPQKRTDPVGCVTPSKENRVLAELHPTPTKTVAYQPPMNLAGLISGAIILEDPVAAHAPLPQRDEQLEQALTTVPTFEDFSMTPSKANLIDPELSAGDGAGLFAAEDFVARRASNFSYGPTLNSIIEEQSPVLRREVGLVAKLMPTRTPPSSCKSSSSSSAASTRKPKRLGTKSTGSSGSLKASPLPKGGVRGVLASPKVLRRTHASLQNPPGMYCGREQLNVLKRLYERNQDSLHILLDYLTDEDLVQVVQVSKGWKEIIQSLPKQWRRLQKFLKHQRGDKENHQQHRGSLPVLPQLRKASELLASSDQATKHIPAATEGQPLPDESSILKRRPFKICNSLDSSSSIGNCSTASGSALLYASFGSDCANVTMPERRRRLSAAATPHSPPVSPSKFKFVANQKVVSHLKQSEQLRPCPRCSRPSRVIFARGSKNGQNKARAGAVAARLEKSYTLPDWDTGNDLNGTIHHTLSSEFGSVAGRNNNDYSATGNSSGSLNGSPNRVRKNLFNCVSAGSSTSQSIGSAAAAAAGKPPTDGRRNSEPHLADAVQMGERRRLRSGTKSVDFLAYPSVAVTTSAADALGGRDSKCDYAVCSRKNCGFQFCIKCLCEYHPDTVCLDLAPNSPSKEEERGRPNVACSRQSRRSLQRLCRKL